MRLCGELAREFKAKKSQVSDAFPDTFGPCFQHPEIPEEDWIHIKHV